MTVASESDSHRSLVSQSINELLEAIAAKQPTPGGGAVASIVAALSSSVTRMVVNYSLGRKFHSAHGDVHSEALRTLKELGQTSLAAAADDARAYGHLNQLWKLAEDDPQRIAQWDDAVADAIAAPQAVLGAANGMLHIMQRIVGTTNRLLDSDLAIGAILAESAARCAAWNIRINLPSVTDRDRAAEIEVETASMLERAAETTHAVEAACRSVAS